VTAEDAAPEPEPVAPPPPPEPTDLNTSPFDQPPLDDINAGLPGGVDLEL